MHQSRVIYAGESESEADLCDASSWADIKITRALFIFGWEMKGFGSYYSFRCSQQYCFSRRPVGISITGLLCCYHSRYIHRVPSDLIKYIESWLSEMEQAPLYDDHAAVEGFDELLLSFTLLLRQRLNRLCSIPTRQSAFPSSMTAKMMPEKLRSELGSPRTSELSNAPELSQHQNGDE